MNRLSEKGLCIFRRKNKKKKVEENLNERDEKSLKNGARAATESKD